MTDTWRRAVKWLVLAIGLGLSVSTWMWGPWEPVMPGPQGSIAARDAAAGALSGTSTPAPAVRVPVITDAMLQRAGRDGKSWLTYGGSYANQRYSPLRRIRKRNVHRLEVRYVVKTGLVDSFQTNPIVTGGIMFLTTPYNHVLAVDARTGRQLWRYEHALKTQVACCGPNNRGVAVYGSYVYMATLDGRVVALDAATGRVVWDREVLDGSAGYSMTLAPLAYRGKVFVGSSGAEFGVRGVVMALDAASGEEVWRFWLTAESGWEGSFTPTTPDGVPLNRDIEAEKAASAKYPDAWRTGGGSVWTTPAYDPELNLLFMGVGNPWPPFDGTVRPGDNLYTSSLVALDADTGELRYYYQYVPHDVWDLDPASPMVLFDVRDARGKRVKAVGHAGKTGWYYIHERATGRLIRKSEPFVPQENLFSPPSPEGTPMLPGSNGGSSWSPAAYSPRTRHVYVLGLHQPMRYFTHPKPSGDGDSVVGSASVEMEDAEQWGTLTAIDTDTGKITWQVRTEQPMIGGALATAGGLVFAGEANGFFRAYDDRTGKVLWEFRATAGVNAPPITFAVGGEQLVAVAAGGNNLIGSPYGDEVIVFGLKKRRWPPVRVPGSQS